MSSYLKKQKKTNKQKPFARLLYSFADEQCLLAHRHFQPFAKFSLPSLTFVLFFFLKTFSFTLLTPKAHLLEEKKLRSPLNKHLFPRKLNDKIVEKDGGLFTVLWISGGAPRNGVFWAEEEKTFTAG